MLINFYKLSSKRCLYLIINYQQNMQLQYATSKKQQQSLYKTRKKYRDRFRKQDHERLFNSVRKTLIETKNQEIIIFNQQGFFNNHPFPIQIPQHVTPNYLQINPQILHFLQNYCQPAQFINNNIQNNQLIPIQPMIEQMKPMIEQMMPQYKLQKIDQNKYFEKQGYIIYKNQIGKGTFSTVWQGMNIATRQKIAAKEVKVVEQNQIRCLANLKSDYIVKIYKIIKHENKNFLILQFCDCNLQQQLDRCQFNKEKVFVYFDQLVQGMDLLQLNNIIHRDLKFQNILVKNNMIKIADFGLAKFMEDELQIESKRCGTPYTMAPEVFFSKSRKVSYSIKSDIWSLGVILHLMLYRRHPFSGKGQDLKLQMRTPIKRKYPILDKLIDKCLLFNPRERINWHQFKHIYKLYKNQQVQICQEQEQSIISQPLDNKIHQKKQLIIQKNRDISKNKYNFQQFKMEETSVNKNKYQHLKMEQKLRQYRKQIPRNDHHQNRQFPRKKLQFMKNLSPKKEIHQIKKPITPPAFKQQTIPQKKPQARLQLPKMNSSFKIPNNPPNSKKRVRNQLIMLTIFGMLVIMFLYLL